MADEMSKADLIVLVKKILSADGSETDLDQMLFLLHTNVPHPAVSDLIYHPIDPPYSAEQIVELALAYQPVALSNDSPARS